MTQSSVPANNNLFVYGTLRSAAGGPLDLREFGELLGEAYVEGELRLVHPTYPGLIDGAGHVTGELWRLRDAATFQMLDDYETPQYERVIRSVRFEGEEIESWVYLFRGDIEDKQVIRSGDWLKR